MMDLSDSLFLLLLLLLLLLLRLLLTDVFSERSLYAIARPSVICLSSVTFVRPTQAVQMFGNISTALATLAIR